MINIWEVKETNEMIEQENLDVRTITLGVSLLDCIDADLKKLNQNIYNKIHWCKVIIVHYYFILGWFFYLSFCLCP